MSPRIVVVDDDLATLGLFWDMLAPEGYRVACASTTEAGMLALRQERPELVILDLRLETPDAGWRLLGQLRAEPSTADLPVIVCSADHRALGERENELREGGCATLKKPFHLDDLLERVAMAISFPFAPLHRRRPGELASESPGVEGQEEVRLRACEQLVGCDARPLVARTGSIPGLKSAGSGLPRRLEAGVEAGIL